jgi:release factor glutamine methyltransferase
LDVSQRAARLLGDATARLADAGVPTARVDAELLLAHVLAVPRSRLVLAQADDDDAARLAALIEQRAARVPLQHLTGRAPFRHLDLAVGPGVFVPRPETELLVDAVLPALHGQSVVVDLCAGSGALALAIADESPGTCVHAVENSPVALAWLRRNARGARNARDDNVRVVDGDVRDEDLLVDVHGTVDVVVSNPPYVPSGTVVDPEVRADPSGAVFAGSDGLALIPAVVARAAALLRIGGLFVLEHDDTHALAVPEMLQADGRWVEIVEHPDLTGRARFVTASRSGSHR